MFKYGLFGKGYDKEGYNRFGYDRSGFDKYGFDIDGYNRDGYDKEGYGRDGFNQNGYNREGYDRQGYDQKGFNINGYDRNGYGKDGFNQDGYDKYGYDRFGFDKAGYNKTGYDKLGYDRQGYDQKGFNRNGYDRNGYDKDGYNQEGYDKYGYDRFGFGKTGYNKAGYNKLGYDREGYNQRGYNRNGYDRNGYDKDGYNQNGYDWNGYDKDGYNQEGYDKDGFNKMGYNRSGYNRKGFDIYGYNRGGYNKRGFNASGYDKEGYDVNGFNASGYDKEGYDVNGFNSEGYNRNGYNRNGYDKDGLCVEDKINKLYQIKLFHEIYGEGVLDSSYKKEKNYYIRIRFDEKICTFAYPDCINKNVFEKETESMLNHKSKMKDKRYLEEYNEEKSKLARIIDLTKTMLNVAKMKVENTKVMYNDFSDSYDQAEFERHRMEHQQAQNEYDEILQSNKQPYFARIDVNDKQLYIGKQGMDGYVVDWRSPESVMYYKYQMYINNANTKLSLVRDFDIRMSKLLGFSDKYNNSEGVNAKNTTDKYLLKIIESMRENNEVHDIIQTIQNNQYNIITCPEGNIVVNGCAGSGKTMILFHRLSYMAFNKNNFVPENVYTISPSLLSLDEADQLVKDLSIDKTNRHTPSTFYFKMIKNICTKMGIDYTFLREFTSEVPNDCSDIYSLRTVEEFISNVNKIIQYSVGNKETDEFINYYSDIIQKEYCFLDHIDSCSNIINIYDHNEELNKKYKEILKAFSETTYHNVSASAERRLKTTSNSDKSSANAIKGNFLKELCAQYSCLFGSKIVYTNKDKVMTDESKNGVSSLLNLFFDSKHTKHKKIVEKIWQQDITTFEFFEKYHSVSMKIDKLKKFKNGDDLELIIEIILYLTKKLKEKYNLNDKYDFEMFYAFCALVELFGEISNENIEIFIDEYQNFSLIELMYIKKAFPMCKFSLFGDLEQKMQSKGIGKIEELYELDKSIKKFEINENYRNAFEITEFINNRLNMKMIPIGIQGSINEKATTIETKYSLKERVVLIVKSKDEISEIDALKDINDINIVDCGDKTIEFNKLNIITVSLSKGLEFEKVYVYDHNMTNIEKYVAYTRALNELNILN